MGSGANFVKMENNWGQEMEQRVGELEEAMDSIFDTQDEVWFKIYDITKENQVLGEKVAKIDEVSGEELPKFKENLKEIQDELKKIKEENEKFKSITEADYRDIENDQYDCKGEIISLNRLTLRLSEEGVLHSMDLEKIKKDVWDLRQFKGNYLAKFEKESDKKDEQKSLELKYGVIENRLTQSEKIIENLKTVNIGFAEFKEKIEKKVLALEGKKDEGKVINLQKKVEELQTDVKKLMHENKKFGKIEEEFRAVNEELIKRNIDLVIQLKVENFEWEQRILALEKKDETEVNVQNLEMKIKDMETIIQKLQFDMQMKDRQTLMNKLETEQKKADQNTQMRQLQKEIENLMMMNIDMENRNVKLAKDFHAQQEKYLETASQTKVLKEGIEKLVIFNKEMAKELKNLDQQKRKGGDLEHVFLKKFNEMEKKLKNLTEDKETLELKVKDLEKKCAEFYNGDEIKILEEKIRKLEQNLDNKNNSIKHDENLMWLQQGIDQLHAINNSLENLEEDCDFDLSKLGECVEICDKSSKSDSEELCVDSKIKQGNHRGL